MPPQHKAVADWTTMIIYRVLGRHPAIIAFWKQTLSYALDINGLCRVLGNNIYYTRSAWLWTKAWYM